MIRGRHVIIGPPGTGKTTRIAQSVEKIVAEHRAAGGRVDGQECPVIVASLTRAAAAEAVGRCDLPPEAVGTIHSFGLRSLEGRRIPKRKEIAEWNERHPAWTISSLSSEDTEIDEELSIDGGGDDGDLMLAELELARHQMVPRNQWRAKLGAFAAAWVSWKDAGRFVDFADLVELASPDAPLGARVIIADEAQDCSRLELDTLERWAESAGALILVGDTRQTLYAWRGADPESLMRKPGDTATRFDTLGHSWRLPRRIHAAAEAWAGNLSIDDPPSYSPRDEDGLVERCDASLDNPRQAVELALERAAEGRRVMILAACAYQLSATISTLRAMALPYSNPWRRRNTRWNPMAARRRVSIWDRARALLEPVMAERLWSCREVFLWAGALRSDGVLCRGAKKLMESWTDSTYDATAAELARVFEPHEFSKIWRLAYDQPDPARLATWWRAHILARYAEPSIYPVGVISGPYRDCLDDQGEPLIHVGTCHSVKGAESDVVIIYPDLSRAGFDAYARGRGPDHDAVIRTFYVGMTRARQELFLCRPSESKGWASCIDWPLGL